MEYRSQKIAYWYFAAALPLFVLQVVVGLWLAANYTFTIPQSIGRRVRRSITSMSTSVAMSRAAFITAWTGDP